MDDNALVRTLYNLEQFCNSVRDCKDCRLYDCPVTINGRCPITEIGNIREWLENDMERKAENED